MHNYPGEVMFRAVPLIMTIIFLIMVIMIVIRVIKAGRKWVADSSSPVLSEKARVITKRTDVSSYGRGAQSHGRRNFTTYFVTFELPDGERKEFKVKDKDYGTLVEGDEGYLTFQGSRYQGFDRF
ncbi:DUF2500 domain-containing protein [Proteinivorax tanatarense]|uniref:DUF2500 domain-containing protein n=1 Tax=Proteinivorax tanatarense TaxID=1260629 RepID=A0AAU7VHB2_9FIRM